MKQFRYVITYYNDDHGNSVKGHNSLADARNEVAAMLREERLKLNVLPAQWCIYHSPNHMQWIDEQETGARISLITLTGTWQ